VKNSTIVISQTICTYSAVLIADAQASVIRAQRAVQRAEAACKEAKKQRELVARVQTNILNSGT